jgi:two-component system chemotaxis response regulator CheY
MKRSLNDFLFLVIDDSEECRQSLSDSLLKLGIGNTISFENGRDAFEFFDKYDGIKECFFLSDLNMPELKGDELFKKVRKTPKGKDAYFFLLTNQSERVKIIDLISEGLNQFILKPVNERIMKKKLDFFIKVLA